MAVGVYSLRPMIWAALILRLKSYKYWQTNRIVQLDTGGDAT